MEGVETDCDVVQTQSDHAETFRWSSGFGAIRADPAGDDATSNGCEANSDDVETESDGVEANRMAWRQFLWC